MWRWSGALVRIDRPQNNGLKPTRAHGEFGRRSRLNPVFGGHRGPVKVDSHVDRLQYLQLIEC
jgi:hypothetical protein